MQAELHAIRCCLEGDTAAFRVVVESYQDRVYRMIAALVRDEHEREDVAQRVFLTAFRKLAQFNPDKGSLGAWLTTIARHQALNWLRARHRGTAEQPGLSAEHTALAQRDPHAERLADAERLDRALERLPVEQRTAFVLSEIDGRSYEEIGGIEGVPTGTIKSRVHRAKLRLRSVLEGDSPVSATQGDRPSGNPSESPSASESPR